MTILDAIPRGRENAKTKAQIAAALGTVPREVEAEIERLRKNGEAAICSSGAGYWQPLTPAEYRDNLERRRRRALSQLVTVRGERRTAKRWEAREAVPLAFAWEAA